jgi:hypothetical protein
LSGEKNFINLKERRTIRKGGIYKRVTEKKETMPDKEDKGKKR